MPTIKIPYTQLNCQFKIIIYYCGFTFYIRCTLYNYLSNTQARKYLSSTQKPSLSTINDRWNVARSSAQKDMRDISCVRAGVFSVCVVRFGCTSTDLTDFCSVCHDLLHTIRDLGGVHNLSEIHVGIVNI